MITVGFRHYKSGAGSKDFDTIEEFEKWFTTDNREFKITGIHENRNT